MYYINMYTGQEESVTGKVVVDEITVGQLQVKLVYVIMDDRILEIPDFCLAGKSRYLLNAA